MRARGGEVSQFPNRVPTGCSHALVRVVAMNTAAVDPSAPPAWRTRALVLLLGAVVIVVTAVGCGHRTVTPVSAPSTAPPSSIGAPTARPVATSAPVATPPPAAPAPATSTTSAPAGTGAAAAAGRNQSTADVEQDLDRMQQQLDEADRDLKNGPTEATTDPRG
jgi:hypothetical protein